MHGQDIDYTNHDFFLGIDVHQKNWKVTIRANRMQLKTFSLDPSAEQLYRYMQSKDERMRKVCLTTQRNILHLQQRGCPWKSIQGKKLVSSFLL